MEAFPADRANISVSIVWIPMCEAGNIRSTSSMGDTGDTEASVKLAALTVQDPRVRHFYDPDKLAGKAVVTSLGATGAEDGEDEVAWDIYLFYEPEEEWSNGEPPPAPVEWMHQLSECSWIDQSRMRCGEALVAELYYTMKKLVAP